MPHVHLHPITTEGRTIALAFRARRLYEARIATGLTLREFAATVGLTPEQVGGLEWSRYDFATEGDRALYLAVLSDRTPR